MTLSSTGKCVCNTQSAIILWLLTEFVILAIQLDIFSLFYKISYQIHPCEAIKRPHWLSNLYAYLQVAKVVLK